MLYFYHIKQSYNHERKHKKSFQFEPETTETDIFKLTLKIMATSFLAKDKNLVFKLVFPNKLIN